MGNSCSSGQAHKGKDNTSQNSGESPSYQVTKPSVDLTHDVNQSRNVQDPSRLEPHNSLKETRKPGVTSRPAGHVSLSDSLSLSSPVTVMSPKELEPSLDPNPVVTLPEEQRMALLGKISQERIRIRNKAMIIYVCAADSQDCCSEKGQLHCGVAKQLRILARKAGWRFHVSDLHWRSPLEQQRDHRFPALCTAELARQSEQGAVVSVIFLNSDLGTPLLPHTMESTDFEAALEATENEDDKKLLCKWYSMDSSASPPCYRLARGAPSRWRREMARALAVLVRALPIEARDAYLTTVVEQEVHNTVLMSIEQARRCIWVCRGMSGTAPTSSPPSNENESEHRAELSRRLGNLQRDLKHHLTEKNIIRVTCRTPTDEETESEEYTSKVRELLLGRLTDILNNLINEQVDPAGINGVPFGLFDEINEHVLFCQRNSQCAANREITLSDIKSYVTSDSTVPMVVVGGIGCGKTTLVSRAISLAHSWLNDAAVVFRYVGLTAQSTSSHGILKSIVDQLSVINDGIIYRKRNDIASLTTSFQCLIKAIGAKRPLLIALIGASRLRGARWLPHALPHGVRIILTVTEETDEPSSSAVMAVVSSNTGPRICRVPQLSRDDAKNVYAAFAAHYTPNSTADEATVEQLTKCPLPLYAKIIAWQNSLTIEHYMTNSETDIEEQNLSVHPDLETQLTQILIGAERTLGMERVEICLSLLVASRRGLDDAEMLDVLARDPLFYSEETYLPWAPASLFWARMWSLLSAWLRADTRGRTKIAHNALDRAASERYASKIVRAREMLVEYFEGVLCEEEDPEMAGRLLQQDNQFSENQFNTRKLEELPFQHYHLLKSNPEEFALKPYFTNLEYIAAKTAATNSTAFLDDIALVKLDKLPEHLEVLKEIFEKHSTALDYDHRQLYSFLKLTLAKMGENFVDDICAKWWNVLENPPVPMLLPINDDYTGLFDRAESQVQADTDCFTVKSFDLIVQLEKCGKFVATASTSRDEICVWDALSCKRVRHIKGVPHPTDLVPIDKYKCVVLCRRELRVYNLDKAEFLVSLKGVMNQMMPYYGLHDANHAVALSRNRMYVNLLDLRTGDCVTTFKAGEDRFLNSLIVSADGRVLVCGDETQKPFPLLVWSLTSRKLLYDLRIPHHEFVTSLAAITHDGNYVCVVCRELDEPSPNFIVVYELQSGTLFKKWKPGVDTSSLAISSDQHCVVCGLADSSILLQDLITGNCRMKLRGHTAPPTILKISQTGSVLTSADGSCHDMSIRVWDLKTGQQLAILTPPERINCYETICGGTLLTMAMRNYPNLATLALEGSEKRHEPESDTYGDPENDGKVFELNESDNT